MWLAARLRAGAHRVYHELTQWYHALARCRFQLLFLAAYVAAVGSIGHFLWRGGGYPSAWEFGLLVVVLVCYLVLALSAQQ